MSLLRKIDMEKDKVLITLEVTKEECEALTPGLKELILIPTERLDRTLVTGKIGTGNRIMVPNKFLKSNDIDFLKKNVQAGIIDTGDKKFLIIELESKKIGIPVFVDE